MSTTPRPGTLTTKQTTTMLEISRPTLYRMMDENVITPLPGKTWLKKQPLYFLLEDVERILREGSEAIAS